jgi:hypothetical protein
MTSFDIVAYSLRARTVEPQQQADTRQWPVNNIAMFPVQFVPMAGQATI